MTTDQPSAAPRCTRRTLVRRGLLAAGGIGAGLACSAGLSAHILNTGVEATSPNGPIAANPAITSALLAANLDFGFRMQNTLLKSGLAQNLFFSPLSISTALDIVYDGAGGTTEQAMATTLGLKTLRQADVNAAMLSVLNGLRRRDPKITLSIADSIWLRNGLVAIPSFVTVLQTYYGTVLQNLDFRDPQAPSIINAWVSQQTHGLIPSIVKDIDAAMVIYLINAVYLKALPQSPPRNPFSEEILALIEKLASTLPLEQREHFDRSVRKPFVYFNLSTVADYLPHRPIVDIIVRAISHRQQIQFKYTSTRSMDNAVFHEHIDPYYIIHMEGHFYLIAFSHKSNQFLE